MEGVGVSTYDLVIRNGTVVDGSGLGSFRADVGIVGDRIAFVGRILDRGAREIDAEGHVVTPGFVDGHTHMDAQVFWDASGSNSCWHGVTTAVMGNCGFTLAPVRPGERPLVVRNLERAEDIDPGRARRRHRLDASRRSPSTSTPSTGLPKGINFAANIGHSALRTWAMGERAFTEEATDDDLDADARAAGRLDPRRRDRLLDVTQRAPRDLRQPAGRVTPRVVGRGRAARRDDGRPRARASSRRPTAACSRPTPTSARAR